MLSEAADGDAGGEEGTEERAEGRSDLEKHADADVRVALADVGGGRSGAGGDDRDERRADGVAKIDVEDGGEQRDKDHATAEATQRADEAGENGADEDQGGEEGERH